MAIVKSCTTLDSYYNVFPFTSSIVSFSCVSFDSAYTVLLYPCKPSLLYKLPIYASNALNWDCSVSCVKSKVPYYARSYARRARILYVAAFFARTWLAKSRNYSYRNILVAVRSCSICNSLSRIVDVSLLLSACNELSYLMTSSRRAVMRVTCCLMVTNEVPSSLGRCRSRTLLCSVERLSSSCRSS